MPGRAGGREAADDVRRFIEVREFHARDPRLQILQRCGHEHRDGGMVQPVPEDPDEHPVRRHLHSEAIGVEVVVAGRGGERQSVRRDAEVDADGPVRRVGGVDLEGAGGRCPDRGHPCGRRRAAVLGTFGDGGRCRGGAEVGMDGAGKAERCLRRIHDCSSAGAVDRRVRVHAMTVRRGTDTDPTALRADNADSLQPCARCVRGRTLEDGVQTAHGRRHTGCSLVGSGGRPTTERTTR